MKLSFAPVTRALIALGWLGLGVTLVPYLSGTTNTQKTPNQIQAATLPGRQDKEPADFPKEVKADNFPDKPERPPQADDTTTEIFPNPRGPAYPTFGNQTKEFRTFELPNSPFPIDPTTKITKAPPGRDRELSQNRYDNREARFNIRETVGRLNSMGIKVTLDWNKTYGLEAPWDSRQCLDENWELKWRQGQLNALMEGKPLPKFQSRSGGMSRVIPVGWKQCGSGICDPNNPYCPYIRDR